MLIILEWPSQIKMGKLSKHIAFYFLVILGLYQLNSCQKAPFNADHRLFIKTFESDSAFSDYGLVIAPLNNGGFIIVSVENYYPLITKTDQFGNIISQKAVSNSSFNLQSGSVIAMSSTGDPWHFLGQAGPLIMRFDTSGKISFQTKVPQSSMTSTNTNSYFFNAVQNGNEFIVPYCDGLGLEVSSTNKIYTYDGNFNLLKTDSISDKRLGGRTQSIYLCTGIQSEPYAIFGQKLPRTLWNSYNNTKIFAARVPATGKVTQTLIDTGDLLTQDQYVLQTLSADSQVVVLGQRYSMVNTNIYYPIAIKFDKNLNIVWKQTYDVDFGSCSCYNIIRCMDGGFIIVGSIGRAGYPDYKPWVLKIDASGNKLWEKAFTSPTGSGEFFNGTQLADGGYAFIGDTKQFGKGKSGNQIIYVRTDANGNY